VALTYTIIFHEEIVSSKAWQLIFTFTSSATGANVSINAEDQHIIITNHGQTKWEYDYENRLLMPGTSNFEIADNDVISTPFYLTR
jgi:hypothetical protein